MLTASELDAGAFVHVVCLVCIRECVRACVSVRARAHVFVVRDSMRARVRTYVRVRARVHVFFALYTPPL